MVYYINEFIRNLFVLIPFFIGFGYISSLGFLYYISIIFVLFLLPIISVGISSFISMPLASLFNYLKRHNFLSAIITIIFILLAFYLTFFLVSQIKTPIRIVQLYNRFVLGLTLTIQRIAAYGSIYNVIGQMLYGFFYLRNLFIFLGTVIVLIALNYFVSKPVYFKLMSSSQENTVRKVKKKTIPLESKTLFTTFLKKEFTIARRSLNELLSNYALLMTLPFYMYVLNYIYMGMSRSSFGNQVVLVINVFITLMIVTGSNTASAVAITTEGYEFVLLKTAPYNTSRMAWAKITFNLIATTIMISLSFFLFSKALPVYPQKDIWMLFVFVIIVNFGHILWSFQIDLLSPKLSDYASTGSISNNANVSKSLSVGLFVSIAYCILSLIAFILFKELGWYLMITAGALFLVYRLYWFNIYLKAYFDEIEY